MGIRLRFLLIMSIVSLIAIASIGAASYKFSVRAALSEARSKGELIFAYHDATRKYFREAQLPLINELVERDRFYPELMSAFALSRHVHENFQEERPGYSIKLASLNPLLPSNEADEEEIRIINSFRDDSSLETEKGQVTKNGEEHFFLAAPIRVEAGCLECHGDPIDAPKDQTIIYGMDSGYGWKVDDIIAAFVVYVPLGSALSQAKHTALSLFLIGATFFLASILIIGFFLDRGVVAPIVKLSKRTEEISLGEGLEESISHSSKDEIGALAKSINRLRISVVKMLKMR